MKKVAAITFGCKINQYETACILSDFVEAGYQITAFSDEADVYVINSCTVTNRTDYKSRNAIRKALQHKVKNSSVKVFVTGCYAQRNFEKVKELGVDAIFDNNHKHQMIKMLDVIGESFHSIDNETTFEEHKAGIIPDHARTFIKIQDGCDFFCHYCAIPYARGKPRSRNWQEVIAQIKLLCAKGYQEFVLGGINLGLYHSEIDLVHLLEKIEAIQEVKMIRLSSIEPQLFSDKLIYHYQNSKKLCPHFHIPLQTGTDEMLSKMNRRYTTKQFFELLNKIHDVRSDTAFGIDVISGLPGETESLFEQTYSFLESIPFCYLHVFSYSRRPGTVAAKMKEQLPGDVILTRSKKLIHLSDQKNLEFRRKMVLSEIIQKGIVEKIKNGQGTSLSDHGLRVYFSNTCVEEKEFCKFKPIEISNDGIKVKVRD